MKRILIFVIIFMSIFNLFGRTRSSMHRLSQQSYDAANREVISFYEWRNLHYYRNYYRKRSKMHNYCSFHNNGRR